MRIPTIAQGMRLMEEPTNRIFEAINPRTAPTTAEMRSNIFLLYTF
jgi:hypothetical protein